MQKQPGSSIDSSSIVSESAIGSLETSHRQMAHSGKALFAIIIILILGTGLGAIMGAISKVYFSIYLLPVFLCIIMGMLLAKVIDQFHVHARLQAILLALLLAGVVFGGFHYTRYLFTRAAAEQEVATKMAASGKGPSSVTPAQVVDLNFKLMTGHKGFIGYVLFMGQQGMSVHDAGSKDSENIGSELTWLYWGAFLLAMVFCNVVVASKSASRPVCPVCGAWMEKAKFMGNLEADREPELVEVLQNGNLRSLKQILKDYCDYPKFVFYLRECNACHRADRLLIIQKAVVTPNGKVQFLNYRSIPLHSRSAAVPGKEEEAA
jgi:hypothetical protein